MGDCAPRCVRHCGPQADAMAMDRHEKGLEKAPDRLDRPLPEWNGSYGGDPRRLPKVVQKLVRGMTLTAEEKAELLWRLFELDQKAQARKAGARRVLGALAGVAALAGAVWLAVYQWKWIADRVMAWLSPPAAPPA